MQIGRACRTPVLTAYRAPLPRRPSSIRMDVHYASVTRPCKDTRCARFSYLGPDCTLRLPAPRRPGSATVTRTSLCLVRVLHQQRHSPCLYARRALVSRRGGSYKGTQRRPGSHLSPLQRPLANPRRAASCCRDQLTVTGRSVSPRLTVSVPRGRSLASIPARHQSRSRATRPRLQCSVGPRRSANSCHDASRPLHGRSNACR
jgi:hypothetical protein